jgi:capsular polysaccharide biosynthesis protein
MDFWGSVGIIVRQWKAVLPATLLVLTASFLVAMKVGMEYQATGTLLMVAPNPPSATAAGNTGPRLNPFNAFSSSLAITADIMSRIMTKDDATMQRMEAAGARAKYDVGTGVDGPGPIISIIATGKTPEEALQTVAVISKGIQDELASRQKQFGAPTDTWIRADPLTMPQQATLMLASPLRAFLAVAALGFAAVVTLAYLLEGLSERGLRWHSSHLLVEDPSS